MVSGDLVVRHLAAGDCAFRLWRLAMRPDPPVAARSLPLPVDQELGEVPLDRAAQQASLLLH